MSTDILMDEEDVGHRYNGNKQWNINHKKEKKNRLLPCIPMNIAVHVSLSVVVSSVCMPSTGISGS